MSAVLRRVLVVCCFLFTLAACEENGAEEVESTSIFPDILSEQRQQCSKDGGRWGPLPGRQSFTCFQELSDANKSCSRATDCQGMCLARSRTCTPFKPFFGCHEVFSSGGARQTRCIN